MFRCQLKHFYFSHYEHTECDRGCFTVNTLYKLLTTVEVIGCKQSYTLNWHKPNNNDDDDLSFIFSFI